MMAQGLDIEAEPLKAELFSKKVGAMKVATTALACHNANKSSIEECKYEKEYFKVVSNATRKQYGLKREGAEQLLYRQLVATKATDRGLQGVNGTKNIGDRGNYALLRNRTLRYADIEKAKADITGDYVMDCRNGGKSPKVCSMQAKNMLSNDLKSVLSLDNALIRKQFDILTLNMSCKSTQCNNDANAQIKVLDLTPDEVKARRYDSSISQAARINADCIESGKGKAECLGEAEKEFKTLASNMKPSKRVWTMIQALSSAFLNGAITEVKKRKETTSVASYERVCNDGASSAIAKFIASQVNGAVSYMYENTTVESTCEVLILLQFDRTKTIEEIDKAAKTTIPKHLIFAGSNSRRRLSTSVDIHVSSSISIGEVDPPLNRSLAPKPVLATTTKAGIETTTTTSAPSVTRKKVENPTKLLRQALSIQGLTKVEVYNQQKAFEAAIAQSLAVHPDDVDIVSVEEVVSTRRRNRRLMASGNSKQKLKIIYTVKVDDASSANILKKMNDQTTYVTSLKKKLASIYNKSEGDLTMTLESATEEAITTTSTSPKIGLSAGIIAAIVISAVSVACCCGGIFLYFKYAEDAENVRRRKTVRGGKKSVTRRSIELPKKGNIDIESAEWSVVSENPMHTKLEALRKIRSRASTQHRRKASSSETPVPKKTQVRKNLLRHRGQGIKHRDHRGPDVLPYS